MKSEATNLLHLIDVFGTFVFALSGATMGVKRGFDIFGVFVIAMVTAIGGGVIRDLCISATPPSGLINIEYLCVIIIAIFIVSFFQKSIISFSKPSNFFDAIGLGFFAAFGANKTYQYTGDIQISIILGCVSAIGGGIIRDVLSGNKPTVLNQELYASVAIIGAFIEILGSINIISPDVSIWLSISIATLIRMMAIKYNIKLPSIKNNLTD